MHIIKPTAFLQFVTGETFDVTSFRCTYNLVLEPNIASLPTAEVQIPTGSSFLTGGADPSKVFANNFEYFRYNLCALFIDIAASSFSNPQNTSLKLGRTRYLVFVGFPIAFGYNTQAERAECTVILAHWLNFLAYPHLFNSAIPSIGTGDFSFFHPNVFALFGFLTGLGLTLEHAPLLLFSQMQEEIDEDKWDLWWHILFPLLDKLITYSIILGSRFRSSRNDPNFLIMGNLARRALWSTNPYLSSIPFSFFNLTNNNRFFKWIRSCDPGISSAREVAREIANIIRRNMVEDIGKFLSYVEEDPDKIKNPSPFTYLQTCLLHLHCALVPYPAYYGVVPFALGLSSYWKTEKPITILPGDILNIAVARTPDQKIAPTRILITTTNQTFHAGAALEEKNQLQTIAGFYRSRRRTTGTVKVVKLPNFYRNVALSGLFLDPTIPLHEILEAENDAKIDEEVADKVKKSINTSALISRFIADKYAQYQFILEHLQYRLLQITTPFRGDIAPGSTIRILIAHPSYAQDTQAILQLQGTVMTVVYAAGPFGLYSIYTIRGWRVVPEVYHPDFSIVEHPIYDRFWVGNYHLPATAVP